MTDSTKPKKLPNPSQSKLVHGNPHSSLVWSTLTDEQKAVKKIQRAEKSAMKKFKQENLQSLRDKFDAITNNAKFLAALNNLTVVQMIKAMEGDTAAFNAVTGITIGRATERQEVKQTTNLNVDGLSNVSDEDLIEIAITNLTNNDE